MIVDWTPFEDIHLNYPIGSHVLVAVLALATRLPVHTVFNYTVPLFGVLTTALVFLFARTVTTSAEVGRYAAAAYGLWANWGSIDYYRWGGLPNLVGMLLFLGALTLLAGSPLDRAKRALLGLLLASMFFTHHHVTMTAACVFAALGIHDFFTCERRRMVDLLWGAAWGLLLGVFYILPYVLKARDLGATSVFETEIPLAPAMMLPGVGLALAILASAGLVWAIASRHANRPTAVLGVTTAALAGLFLCFEYVVPFVSARWWGDAYVAFTPSRFLTDLVYCLAIFAGYALYRLRVLLRLAPGVAMTAVLLLGLTQYSVWQHLYSIPTVPQPKWEAYQWIQAHTAPDTIVLDDGRWSVYGTWRRTAQTSIPVSEPQTRDTPKHRLIEALQSGRRPLAAGAAQVVAIRAEASAQDVGHILWRHSSGVVIVEVWPGANPALR
jgi:hypothetical protein